MALSPELSALKAQCTQALALGASLPSVDEHLRSLGAKAPPGIRKEQFLLAILTGMENAKPAAPKPAKPAPVVAKAPEPVKEPEPVVEPEPVKAAEPEPVKEPEAQKELDPEPKSEEASKPEGKRRNKK